MKQYLLICGLGVASCTGNGTKSSSDSLKADNSQEDTAQAATLNTPVQNMEYCFIHTAGLTRRIQRLFT